MEMAGAVHGRGRRWADARQDAYARQTPLSTDTVRRVVDLALGPPPGEETHWTGRMLAKAAGVSLRSVQRILEAHQLAPHRIRTFKLSTDPKFAEKFKDVVGSTSILPPMRSFSRSTRRDPMGVGGDRRSSRVRLLPDALWRRPMQIVTDRPQAPTAIRTDLGAIFVSLELSRSTWLVTSLSPGGGEKMSKHTVRSGDVASLRVSPLAAQINYKLAWTKDDNVQSSTVWSSDFELN